MAAPLEISIMTVTSTLVSSPLRRAPMTAAELLPPTQPIDPVRAAAEGLGDHWDGPKCHSTERKLPEPCAAPQRHIKLLPRRGETELSLRIRLGISTMMDRFACLPRPESLEFFHSPLCRDFAEWHESIARELYWPSGVQGPVAVLDVGHVDAMLEKFFIHAWLAHHLYWLMVSPAGPEHLVAFTPRARGKLKHYLGRSDTYYADHYIENSQLNVQLRACKSVINVPEQIKEILRAIVEASKQETLR